MLTQPPHGCCLLSRALPESALGTDNFRQVLSDIRCTQQPVPMSHNGICKVKSANPNCAQSAEDTTGMLRNIRFFSVAEAIMARCRDSRHSLVHEQEIGWHGDAFAALR